MTSRRAVFLDRDGVINEESADHIKTTEELRPIPGSLDAIARLSRAGWIVVVVTNQSGIGRGLYDEQALTAIHESLERSVEALGGTITAFFHCPHVAEDRCACRKPKPGLIERAEAVLGLTAHGAPLIGDRLSDLEAGIQLGCEPFLVRTGHGERTASELAPDSGVAIHPNLAAAAEALLRR